MVSTSASSSSSTTSKFVPANSWKHFVAGGVGGMCGGIVTSPFDVVKTRLQSSFFLEKQPASAAVRLAANGATATVARPPSNLLWHFVETAHILQNIYREESPRALFKGLGPTLVGVIPASSIKFFTYGNGKQLIAHHFNNGQENAYVHLSAAAIAGVCTGTATNPIWVVKTRLQLASIAKDVDPDIALAKNGRVWMILKKIVSEEGIRGLYKGLSASYLGVTEGTIQWVLYEKLKKMNAVQNQHQKGGLQEWTGMLGSAGSAKFVASVITYPHEVIRTRLRQPKVDGVLKYTGLVQTLRLVVAEEGVRSLYGGLSAHLMRVIPNAAVMFLIYERILRWDA